MDWLEPISLSCVSLSPMQLLELVGLIAHGPLEAIPWSGLLKKLHSYLQCHYISLTFRQASLTESSFTIRIWGETGDAQLFNNEDFAQKYYSSTIDPFNNLPVNRMVIPEKHIDKSDWLEGAYFQQFLAPFDMPYLMGANIVAGNGAECRFRVCRSGSGISFSDSDLALCQLLLPHLVNAVQLHSKLDLIKSERMLYAYAIDCLQMGVIIVNDSAMVLSSNEVANKILRERDGIRLVGDKIQLHYVNENKNFQLMLSQAASRQGVPASQLGDAIAVTRPSGQDQLGILIRSTPKIDYLGQKNRPAAMVFIRDPTRKTLPSGGVLRQLFSFSAAEAALAELLARGLSLDAAAHRLGVSKNTARTQLKALFAKTGATRQAALIQILLGSVAIL